MSRFMAIILLISIILPVVTIPLQVNAQPITAGISIKSGLYGLVDPTPTNETVRILRDGSITIVINKTKVPWLVQPGAPAYIRISLLKEEDIAKPFYRGAFINVSTDMVFHGFFGGLIDITKNSTLYNINGTECGNVTVIDEIVVVWIRFDRIEPLENVPYWTYDLYTGTYRVVYETLYNTELRLTLWDPRIEQYAMSLNKLIVFKVIYECKDVEISVYYSPAVFNDQVTVIVSFENMFSRIESITGIELDVTNVDRIIISMANNYNLNEIHYIASYINGIPDYSGEPVFIPVDFYALDRYSLNYTGIVDDYAPLTPDPETTYLSTLYMFIVEFEHSIINETNNLTFRITVNSTCVSTETTPYLRINASLEVFTFDYVGNEYVNPGDYVYFIAHNVPATHLNQEEYVVSFNLSNVLAIPVELFNNIEYYFDGVLDGVIVGGFYLPEYPYGGRSFVTFLVFSDNKYIMDGVLMIKPYILTYVLTSTSAYAEDKNSYYIGGFVPGDTSAPGDYVVIKGYGFDLTYPIDARFNNTGLLILDRYSVPEKGFFKMLVKLLNRITYEPVPLGTGELYIGTPGTPNYATLSFNTVVGEPFKKVLFNPEWFRNETCYYIKHSKIGDPYLYFTVKYFDPVLDNIVNATWPHDTIAEIIGWDSEIFVFKLYNKFFERTYEWFSLELVNGYGIVNLKGLVIPLMPYGNYTLIEEPLVSVGDRTVFTVYMSIDVDVDPCRNGTFNVVLVGGAPNTVYNLTFSYETYFMGTDKPYTFTPWEGEFSIQITTNEYGYGFYSTNITNIYTTDMVVKLTWYTLVYLNINGTGSAFFWYKWNGSIISITDTYMAELLDPGSDIDFESRFYVNITYNINVTLVGVEYIPRYYFVISVPEVVLPSDTIVVQIFPHKVPVYDLFIEPAWLFKETELKWGWYVYARLVDPLTNTIVTKFEGFNVARIVEDVDGDGIGEIWFVVKLTAPLVIGVDKTYRVDVRVFITIMEPDSNITGVNVVDQGCIVHIDLNGTIYWRGLYSGLMLGGDNQIVTVLGILYGEIVGLRDTFVYINATFRELEKLIKVDLMELMKSINNTLVLIREDLVEIRSGVGRLETKIDTLLNLVRYIDGNVTLILTCCRNVRDALSRVESTANNTYLYVMYIEGNLTRLIRTVNEELLPKFTELYRNISILINDTGDYIVEKLILRMEELFNKSTEILVEVLREEVRDVLVSAIETILDKIDKTNASIIQYIDSSTERIIGSIEENVDEAVYKLTIEIVKLRDELTGLITRYVDELKIIIRENTTLILSSIENTNLTIHYRLNELLVRLNEVNKSIVATIYSGIFALNTTITSLAKALRECCEAMYVKMDSLDKKVSDLYSIVVNVGDSISTVVVGGVTALRDLLVKLSSDTETSFKDIRSSLVDITSLLRASNTTLITRMDNLESSIASKIADAAGILSSKIDLLERRQSEGFAGLGTNLSLFSITILLLEIVIIALIGYSLIRRPVG